MSFLSSKYNFKLIFREVGKLTLKCVNLNNGINLYKPAETTEYIRSSVNIYICIYIKHKISQE